MKLRPLALVIFALAGGASVARADQAAGDQIGPVVKARYHCDDGRLIAARYPTGVPQRPAILTIGGQEITFQPALSADGGRYLAVDADRPGWRLEWWIKGNAGTLSHASADEGPGAPEKTVITICHEVRP